MANFVLSKEISEMVEKQHYACFDPIIHENIKYQNKFYVGISLLILTTDNNRNGSILTIS